MTEIIIAVISGGVTLVVCLINNSYQQKNLSKAYQGETDKIVAVMSYKIDELTKHVEKHNGVIDRTYKLEEFSKVCDEKMKVMNHRIADLEDTPKS